MGGAATVTFRRRPRTADIRAVKRPWRTWARTRVHRRPAHALTVTAPRQARTSLPLTRSLDPLRDTRCSSSCDARGLGVVGDAIGAGTGTAGGWRVSGVAGGGEAVTGAAAATGAPATGS